MNKILALVLTFAFVLFLGAITNDAAAQTADTTAARKQRAHREEAFRDENGNGVNDRLERRIRAAERKKDRFVDADGDGICDGRAGGLGFRRGSTNPTTIEVHSLQVHAP